MSNIPILMYVVLQQNDFDAIQKCCQKFASTNRTVKFEFFTDVFECAKNIMACEADCTFVDSILFEKFFSALGVLKPKEIQFTFKRMIIFSKTPFVQERMLALSAFGIRYLFAEFKNFQRAIKAVHTQLTQFAKRQPKISLCLSGGGFDGYMYSLGVCHGLEQCLRDFEMADFDIFCGISSGSILAACFAGGLKTSSLVQQAQKKHPELNPITTGTLLDFALFDFLKSTFRRKLPVGLFKGEKLKNFLSKQIEYLGAEDSLEKLKKNLYIFATDQDTGETVVFGKTPWQKNIKISQAIRASIALPPFYLPENINGHWFTDGQLATSTDFDLPIHEKSGLIVMIEPIVAYSTAQAGGVKKRGGYFMALQAIKKLVHSRSNIALQHARDKHPDVDFIKFEPTHEVMEIMSGNPMRLPIRSELIDASARATCYQILRNYESFQHKFAKHGLILKPYDSLLTLLNKDRLHEE